MDIRKQYLKQLDKTLKVKENYKKQKTKLISLEQDVKGWFAAQYKEYNYNHYIIDLKIINADRQNIVFAIRFTDTSLNGTLVLPIDKVMSLDVTYDDFKVVPYSEKSKK